MRKTEEIRNDIIDAEDAGNMKLIRTLRRELTQAERAEYIMRGGKIESKLEEILRVTTQPTDGRIMSDIDTDYEWRGR